MRTLKLTVAYDGSGYHGFQRQPRDLTVQQVLEEALSRITGEEVTVAGSGRTDSGVRNGCRQRQDGQRRARQRAGCVVYNGVPDTGSQRKKSYEQHPAAGYSGA